jgi:hypothetical protein
LLNGNKDLAFYVKLKSKMKCDIYSDLHLDFSKYENIVSWDHHHRERTCRFCIHAKWCKMDFGYKVCCKLGVDVPLSNINPPHRPVRCQYQVNENDNNSS